ncbi:unnamed protein product [Brassica rapa subsp. trilocularis]
MYKYYIHTEDAAAKRIAKWYVATILVGSVCWFCDRVFCERVSRWPVNPQGTCSVALFYGVELLLREHVLDVLSSSAAWVESEGEVLSWSSSLCQDREAENAMRGRAQKKQIIYIAFFCSSFCQKISFYFFGK